MKTLFDEPIYKSGPALYQEIGRNGGMVKFRWRYTNETEWQENNNCTQRLWEVEVVKRGVICEDAV